MDLEAEEEESISPFNNTKLLLGNKQAVKEIKDF